MFESSKENITNLSEYVQVSDADFDKLEKAALLFCYSETIGGKLEGKGHGTDVDLRA